MFAYKTQTHQMQLGPPCVGTGEMLDELADIPKLYILQWPGKKGKESRNEWPEAIQQVSNWAEKVTWSS